MSTKKCWEPKKSRKHNGRTYFVNIESGVSQWGRQDIKDILPAGWEYCISKSGKIFYYNMHYKRAQWEKPTEYDTLTVPEGFEEMRSTKCKNVYYMNSVTAKTQWEYPREEILTRESEGDIETRVNALPEAITEKVRREANTQTPTRNNRNRNRNRKVKNLQKKVEKLFEENRDLNHDFIKSRQEIQAAKDMIRDERDYISELQAAKDEISDERQYNLELEAYLDKMEYDKLQADINKKQNEEYKPQFNKEADLNLYDVREFVQRDLQRKKDEGKKAEQEFDEDYDKAFDEEFDRQTNQTPDADQHIPSDAQQRANQILADDRKFRPAYGDHTEVKPLTQDRYGFGLPFSTQNRSNLAAERLKVTREQ